MYPIILVASAQIACVLAVSKSARYSNAVLLWAWCSLNLLLTAAIYVPVIGGPSYKNSYWPFFFAIIILNLVVVILVGQEDWLSIEPYIIACAGSLALDYWRQV